METWLLALDLAGVTLEEALTFEGLAEGRVTLDERAGDTVCDRLYLSAFARSRDLHLEVVRVLRADRPQGSEEHLEEVRTVYVLVEYASVDFRSTLAEVESDLRDRGLALADGVGISCLRSHRSDNL